MTPFHAICDYVSRLIACIDGALENEFKDDPEQLARAHNALHAACVVGGLHFGDLARHHFAGESLPDWMKEALKPAAPPQKGNEDARN